MEPYKCMSLEDLPGEEWRPVVGMEKYYSVSNLGRVKRLPRRFIEREGGKNTSRVLKEKVIVQGERPSRNYLFVYFSQPGKEGACRVLKRLNKGVSRLVVLAFLDPDDTFSKKEVGHIDGDYRNNRVDNLVIRPRGTHRRPGCSRGTRKGSAHHKAKLSEDDVRVIRHLYSEKAASIAQLAEEYGVSTFAMHCVIRRHTWKHVE